MRIKKVFLYAQQGISTDDFIIQIRQWLYIFNVILIHHQREPEPQFCNFHCTRVNVNTVKGMFNTAAFEFISSTGILPVNKRRQHISRPHNLAHHAHRKGAGTHCRVTDCDFCQFLVNQCSVVADAFGQFVEIGSGLFAFLYNSSFVFADMLAGMYQSFDIFLGYSNTGILSVVIQAGSLSYTCCQVINQALLAHVVHNLTGSVIDAEFFIEFVFLAFFAAL